MTLRSFVPFVSFVLFVSLASAQRQDPPTPTQAQQRPLFRGGTHFVRVDAYPAANGKIVEGLAAEDFEVLEDGKAQTIESFDFVKFETFTPEAARVEPRTQEEGFEMAADPRNRVFVIVVDLARTADKPGGVNTDIHAIQQPLAGFLDRVIGPRDLFGFLITRNNAKDLVLMRKTAVVEDQIRDMFRSANIDRTEADDLDACANRAASMKRRFGDDQTYTLLEGLVARLGAVREERKSIVFVANSIDVSRPINAPSTSNGQIPRIGIANGRIGIGDHDGMPIANDAWCSGEMQRLTSIDFENRFYRLLDEARRQNVAFYTIAPEGLTTHRPDDNLITLANQTDGMAIVNSNDLTGGMKKIADDLQAYYVLGYYTTNTRFDGGIRKISVKLKGKSIRARREYRAPTDAEIAAMASPVAAPASKAQEEPAAIVGEPTAFRVSPRQAPEQVRSPEVTRVDRIRVTWPILAPLDRREARLLDSTGKPLPFDLPVSEDPSGKSLVVELALAPFARGTYSIELTAASGGRTEHRRVTFLMK
jgi:VWFA-related protein